MYISRKLLSDKQILIYRVACVRVSVCECVFRQRRWQTRVYPRAAGAVGARDGLPCSVNTVYQLGNKRLRRKLQFSKGLRDVWAVMERRFQNSSHSPPHLPPHHVLRYKPFQSVTLNYLWFNWEHLLRGLFGVACPGECASTAIQ